VQLSPPQRAKVVRACQFRLLGVRALVPAGPQGTVDTQNTLLHRVAWLVAGVVVAIQTDCKMPIECSSYAVLLFICLGL
jgi:hypothetical protein